MSKLDEFWKKAVSANNQHTRDYWLDRYDKEETKQYKPKLRKIRKIDDILKDNNK